jgi:hypothetical protein
MGNTRINYMYRDAGNNKYRSSFVVRGEISIEELKPFLYRDHVTFEDQYVFVPSAVGLAHLLTDKWDSELDHDFHEVEEFETVDEEEVFCASDEILIRFKAASSSGWFEYRPK